MCSVSMGPRASVEESTRFELIVSQAIVRTLGLTVPQSLLARADEVTDRRFQKSPQNLHPLHKRP